MMLTDDLHQQCGLPLTALVSYLEAFPDHMFVNTSLAPGVPTHTC